MSAQAQARRDLVRSYQSAFRFETMIYKFGRDLPLPRPVPARTLLYGLAVWPVMLLVVYRLPVIGAVFDALNWLLRDVGIPLAVTLLLAVAEVQGRRFHVALRAWSKHWVSAKHLAGGYRPVNKPGGYWRPQNIVFISDGRCGAPPDGLRLEGPGKVALRYPCEARQRGAVLTIRQVSTTPCLEVKVLTVAPGATVRFRGIKESTVG